MAKSSRAKALETKLRNEELYDKRVATYYLSSHDQGYRELLDLSTELRAVYNTFITLQRENHAWQMFKYCEANLATAKDKSRAKAEGALAKWRKIQERTGFQVAREMDLEDLVKSGWATSGKLADTLLKAVLSYRDSTIQDRPKLNSKVLQNTITQRASRAWKQYLARKSERYGMPSTVKGKTLTVEFNPQTIGQVALAQGYLTLAGISTGLRLGGYIEPDQVQSARVKPEGSKLRVEIIYRIPKIEITGESPRWLRPRSTPSWVRSKVATEHQDTPLEASIDPGVNALLTVAFNHAYLTPLLYDGHHLKSENQWANKEQARLQEAYAVGGVSKGKWSQLETLWGKRNRRVNHELHSIAADLVSRLYFMGVDKVWFNWNPGFKASPHMGRRNNQNFSSLPLGRLEDLIFEYCHLVGLEVEAAEESYTSAASFLDRDEVPVYSEEKRGSYRFSGKRISRGQYRSASGQVIHADVNAALNQFTKSNRRVVLSTGVGSGVVVAPWGVPAVWRPRRKASVSVDSPLKHG